LVDLPQKKKCNLRSGSIRWRLGRIIAFIISAEKKWDRIVAFRICVGIGEQAAISEQSIALRRINQALQSDFVWGQIDPDFTATPLLSPRPGRNDLLKVATRSRPPTF